MTRKTETVVGLFLSFFEGVAIEEDDSGFRKHDFSGLSIFQLISMWKSSIPYVIKKASLEDFMRHYVIELDLETLIAALTATPSNTIIEEIILERILKIFDDSLSCENVDIKINVSNIQMMASFFWSRKNIIESVNCLCQRFFGCLLNSPEFEQLLSSHEKVTMGRKQSLAYGLFSLIVKHNFYLKGDELFTLRQYLANAITERKLMPSFNEALKMWHSSARLPEISQVLEGFMVEEINSIKSLAPLNDLPSWFLRLFKKQDLPPAVVSALVVKIRDIQVFQGVDGLEKVLPIETEPLPVSEVVQVVVEKIPFWQMLKKEVFSFFNQNISKEPDNATVNLGGT